MRNIDLFVTILLGCALYALVGRACWNHLTKQIATHDDCEFLASTKLTLSGRLFKYGMIATWIVWTVGFAIYYAAVSAFQAETETAIDRLPVID